MDEAFFARLEREKGVRLNAEQRQAVSFAKGMALLAAGVLLCVLSQGNVTLLVCALFVLSRAGRQGRQRRKTPLRLGLKERA